MRAPRASPVLAMVLIAGLSAGRLPAEDLTLDWILDPDTSRVLSAPSTTWMADESLLLEDPAKPEAERNLERFDPRTLERKPALDAAKAIEAWKGLLGADKSPQRIGPPDAAAADARTLLYIREGDLFLLDLEASSVRRLTNTEASEENAEFSPDGKWISYVRESDIFAADVASGRERRLTRDGSSSRLNGSLSWVYWEEIMDRRDAASWWAPDSSSVLYLQSDESSVSFFPLPDFEPAVPRVREQRYPKAGGINPTVRAGFVDLERGPTRWIDLSKAAEPGSIEYIVRCVWLPDSSAAAVATLNRAQNRLQLWLAPRSTAEPRRVFEESAKTYLSLHDDLRFLPDGKSFLWLSERSGWKHLYLEKALSLESGAASSLPGAPASGTVTLTSGEWVVRGGGLGSNGHGSVAWLDAAPGKPGSILFHAARPAPAQTQLYRVLLDGTGLARVTEGEGTHSVSVSPKGQFFVDHCSRAGVPPRLTLHRIDGSLLHVLHAASSEKLTPFQLVPPETFTVKTDDGTELPAELTRPNPLEAGRKYPAIVYIYGGPGAPAVADSWDGTWYLFAQLLARRGFAVFTVDPRSAADQGKANEDSVYRKFYGEGELRDILAGVRHLKSLPFVDPERVGIWGWSGGGTNTMYAMTHSKEFRAGIAVAGVADQRYYDTVYTERYMGTPAENEEGYRSIAPANAAANLHGRILIVHGTADDNVHPQNAMRMIDSLIAAEKQFDLLLYPRRSHGIGDRPARKHLFQAMLDFWERNLKGQASEKQL